MPASPAAARPPRTLTDERWLNVLDVNLNGNFLVRPRLRPAHARRRDAVTIVNIPGSMSGFIVNRPAAAKLLQCLEGRGSPADRVAGRRMGIARRPRQRRRADLYRQPPLNAFADHGAAKCIAAGSTATPMGRLGQRRKKSRRSPCSCSVPTPSSLNMTGGIVLADSAAVSCLVIQRA